MGEVRTVTSADESALVTAAKAGDRSAFDELVRQTHAAVYTLAYRLTGNEEDARDVTQDAYLRAYKGLRRFRGEARFGTWMYRITANCAATHLGRRQRHRHEELFDDAPVADVRSIHDPALRAEAGELRASLLAALDRLPPKLRAVVVLRDIYDLPHEAIAAELDISETAAKVRLHRARRQLRDDLFAPGTGASAHAV
jgi:RNA polymerase sigma-70 factor, ECF subfamily